MPRLDSALVLAALAASPTCARPEPAPPAPDASVPAATIAPAPAPAPTPPARATVTLLAGGDISFGRLQGQVLLKAPSTDFFTALRPWLDAADVRFANLEGPLSDQRGETQRPGQQLVFTGPPEGAPALARARFDVVSTANNHAWDYGEPALRETLALLDRAGVRHAGTGVDREAAHRAAIVEVEGLRVAVLAVTDIWNDGLLARHPADAFVARADGETLAASVRALREAGAADAVVVSYHGGAEYADAPLSRTTAILHAAVDAGADAVVGHHPHVVQGVEWYRGRPILYSLGNLLMRMHRDHPWTELGYLARLELGRGTAPRVWACPFRIFGLEVLPLAGDAHREAHEPRFYAHLRAISAPLGGIAVDPPGADGCAQVRPPTQPTP
jgi:poly-gamma-glutamate synthesis protein (capsule biosynthesis protein)